MKEGMRLLKSCRWIFLIERNDLGGHHCHFYTVVFEINIRTTTLKSSGSTAPEKGSEWCLYLMINNSLVVPIWNLIAQTAQKCLFQTIKQTINARMEERQRLNCAWSLNLIKSVESMHRGDDDLLQISAEDNIPTASLLQLNRLMNMYNA